MRIKVGITIDAPPGDAWQVVAPIEHHVDWMVDAESIRFLGSQTRGVGTTFDCVTKVGPIRLTDRMTVTEWDPGRSMGIEHRGFVTGRGRFTLRRRPRGRTRFTWNERLTFPWWMGGPAGAIAAKPILRAIWRRNLRRLKTIVEAA
ncbi:MAG TPA: SRPBCC family protein [Acidimicrobiia bacterium]|nr:SRPBCC family protein [Acidimicrobiia bacterium]